MLIPSLIYYKTRNNMRLTSEEEAQVRRAMGEPLDRLRTLESEAAYLRERLVVLNQRKKDTEHFIKIHQGLLSPIRRLHPEILQEIFCRCLPIAHNSVLSFKEAPLLLGRVCSQWQQIAYSTPALWSSLHINTVPLTSAGARARFEAFGAWFTRSGRLPLSISMSTIMDHHMFSQECRPYFNLITKYVRRWKSIHFQAQRCDPMCFLMEINADDLPLLETFHIEDGSPSASSYSKKGGIFSAPLLRDLSVYRYPLRLLDLPIDCSNLVGLDSSLSDLSDVFRLLSLSCNLESCTLRGSLSFSSQPSNRWPRIVLPKLRTLHLYGVESIHQDALLAVLNNLFQRLNEPLEELNLRAYTGKTSDLIDLLYLCTGLKRLSLRSFLRLFSTSEKLLGKLLNDRLLLGFIPYERRSHCNSCSPTEESEGEQVEIDGSVLASSTCLCPNLEVLNATGVDCSKHILLEFLHSRLVDYGKYDIARLRRFRISSCRPTPEDDDMKGEIDKLAEKSGLQVKLELHSPAAVSIPLPCSPPPHGDPFIEELPVL